MIIREWRGRTTPDRAEVYPDHFRNSVLPELRKLDGFIGATLCRRSAADAVEYLILTRWRSLDAIRAFAGAELDIAVVEPGAVAALTDFEHTVRHYELIEEDGSSAGKQP
jgi:heme-degrading monooxygenase HmoA